MKREKQVCPRCQTATYLETHHILPQTTFKGQGDLVEMCPNCHNEFHIELGKKTLKEPNAEFHYFKFWKWYFTGSLIVAGIWLLVG